MQKELIDFNRNRCLLYGREFRIPEEMVENEESAADPARYATYSPVAWEKEADRAIRSWIEDAWRITEDSTDARDLDEKIALYPDIGQDFVKNATVQPALA